MIEKLRFCNKCEFKEHENSKFLKSDFLADRKSGWKNFQKFMTRKTQYISIFVLKNPLKIFQKTSWYPEVCQ